jgi:hypothetical protein
MRPVRNMHTAEKRSAVHHRGVNEQLERHQQMLTEISPNTHLTLT